MKYNIGDIIIWLKCDTCVAEIINMNQIEYIGRFIVHPYETFINYTWQINITYLEKIQDY